MRASGVLLAGVLLAANFAHAQPAPEYSRVTLPSNLDALLQARLLRSQDLNRIKDSLELLQRLIPQDELRRIQNEVARQLENPNLTPQELKDRAELLQEVIRKQLNLERLPNLPEFKNIQPNSVPQATPSPSPRTTPNAPASLPRFDVESNETLIEMVREFLEDLKGQRWAQGLTGSDEFQDLLNNLNGDFDWGGGLNGVPDNLNLPWLPRDLPRLPGNIGSDFLRNLPTPKLPEWNVPMPEFRGFNLRMPRLPRISPRFSGVGTPSGGTVIWVVVWLFLVGVLWWALTKALGRSPLALLFGKGGMLLQARRRIASMPARLATRGDVILAFELLAQRQLGDQVRTWNHRAVARAWGSEAGQSLAQLYEVARYTPGGFDLSDDERTRAERAVAQLQT